MWKRSRLTFLEINLTFVTYSLHAEFVDLNEDSAKKRVNGKPIASVFRARDVWMQTVVRAIQFRAAWRT